MKTLKISAELSLPVDMLTQATAVVGVRGSGKTTTATDVAEELLELQQQVVIIDPLDVWKKAGYPIAVLGGESGDVPIYPDSGKAVADFVVDKRASVILSLRHFESKADERRFVTDFAVRLYARKGKSEHRTPMLLIIDEASLFCLTPDTEVLTAGGWKPIPQINVGDSAVAFDLASGAYVYQPVERVIRREFSGELVHLQSRAVDCLATPEHRVVLRRNQRAKGRSSVRYPWTFVPAAKVPTCVEIPPGGAPIGPGLSGLSETDLRIMGWIITDGYFHHRARGFCLGLSQSIVTEKRGVRIADVMTEVLASYAGVSRCERPARTTVAEGRPTRGAPSIAFYFAKKASAHLTAWLGEQIHRIPRQVLENGNGAQLEALFQGMMEGDGTAVRRSGNWSAFYAGKNEGLADDFQELALKVGWSATKRFVPQNAQWTVLLAKRVNHWIRRPAPSVGYTGDVWDITIGTGAFVARRNGKVFVTGNCPQQVKGDTARMVGAIQNLVRQGRVSGIGVMLIDQRPATVNKDVLTQVEMLIVHRITNPHDRKAIGAWIEHQGADEARKILQTLQELARGEAWVWSPSWLGIMKRVQMRDRRTFDSSATPKLGQQPAAAQKVAPIDLETLSAALASEVAKAKDEDPRELRKQIKELERERDLALKVDQPGPTQWAYDQACAALKAKTEERDALRDVLTEARKQAAAGSEAIRLIVRALEGLPAGVSTATLDTAPPREVRGEYTPTGRHHPLVRDGHHPVKAPAPRSSGRGESSGDLPKGERAVLTAIAQHQAGVTREQITVLTGYKRSTRDLYLQTLGRKGFIVTDRQEISATFAGVAALGPDFERLPTGAALRRYWLYIQTVGRRKLITTNREGVRASEQLF